MGPVDRGLFRGRRADLDASRLAMHARYKSSPGQCSDTSLEGRTHDAWGEESRAAQEDFTSVLKLRSSGNRGAELAASTCTRTPRLLEIATIALDPMS